VAVERRDQVVRAEALRALVAEAQVVREVVLADRRDRDSPERRDQEASEGVREERRDQVGSVDLLGERRDQVGSVGLLAPLARRR